VWHTIKGLSQPESSLAYGPERAETWLGPELVGGFGLTPIVFIRASPSPGSCSARRWLTVYSPPLPVPGSPGLSAASVGSKPRLWLASRRPPTPRLRPYYPWLVR